MDHKTQIRNITLIGLAGNVVLSILKFIIGILGNSQAVVADALHSLSDTSSDLVILFGVSYWTAPPDEDHPFGHHKIESFVSIVIGLILMVVAAGIGYESVVSLLGQKSSPLNRMVVIGPLISMVIKEVLFKITYRVGVQTNSSSLKANAWHHRTDALSSIPVLIAVGACLINPTLWFLDQIGAIIVSAFIIKVGVQIAFENINDLLDTGISKDKIIEIKKVIAGIEKVKGMHKLRTRKLANYIYIDLHLQVSGALSVTEGHDISEQVKQALLNTNQKIIDVMVHLEPVEA